MVIFYGNHKEQTFCSDIIKSFEFQKILNGNLDFFNVKKFQTISENVAK